MGLRTDQPDTVGADAVIMISFVEDRPGEEGEDIVSVGWPQVPSVGDTVTLLDTMYTVKSVGWGHGYTGMDHPQFSIVGATVLLVRVD